MRIRFIVTFAWFYGWSSLKRGPTYIISYLSLPLSLLFLVYVLSQGRLVSYSILGGLISVIASNSLSSIGDFAFMRLELRLQDLLVATEVGPMDYMAGLMLGNLLFSSPGVLVYLLMGYLIGLIKSFTLPLLMGVLLLVLISTSSLSMVLASRLKHTRHSWGLAGLLSIAFTVIPPMYYPYDVLPRPILYALMLSPPTPGAVILQSYYGLAPGELWPGLVLVGETVAFLLMARYFTRWRE